MRVVLPSEDPAVVRERDGVGNQAYRTAHRWRNSDLSINALITGEMIEDGGRADGWSVVHVRDNSEDNGGVTTHRGVLHPDEYVDEDLLRRMVEEEFGYTHEQIESVYSVKKLKTDQRQLRDAIDARMLALRRSGANMFQFAEAIGLNQRTMNRALVRAEASESA